MTDHEHERRVGLGRVVEDHLAHDRPDPDDHEPAVVDASAQSFPASDPPTFMSEPATPREGSPTDDEPSPTDRR